MSGLHVCKGQVTNYGQGGGGYKKGGGACEVLPLCKGQGAETVLAMLKGEAQQVLR